MLKKLPSAIESIKLNRATFSNASIENLTFVNFFFGENGVGKTSIARCIAEDDGLSWMPGTSEKDFDVLVYDRDFVDANFTSYAELPGVFTFGEKDAEARSEIAKLQSAKSDCMESLCQVEDQIEKSRADKDRELDQSKDEIAKSAKADRDYFKSALTGWYQPKKFAEAVLKEENPEDQNLDDLKQLYSMAFDKSITLLKPLPVPKLDIDIDTAEDLLDTPFISYGGSKFTELMNDWGASDWVRQGFEKYEPKADGRCPYCQRELSEELKEAIAKAWDEDYKKEVAKLEKFQKDYKSKTEEYIRALESNTQTGIPAGDEDKLQKYEEKLDSLKTAVKLNLKNIEDKVESPSKTPELENTDSISSAISKLIDEINADIAKQNGIIENQRQKKVECGDKLKKYFAFQLAGGIKDYRDKEARFEQEIKKLEADKSETEEKITSLDEKIADLNKRNANTEAAVDSINEALSKSGFQGFSIRAKSGDENLYEVVRNGSIVKDLSDGERNFIAFLYFIHLAKGNLDPEKPKEKVVVIDDPVSALDASHLSTVSSIVSKMICSCERAAEGQDLKGGIPRIRQIFILTHNLPFYGDVTSGQDAPENLVSFYLVKKGEGNRSSVEFCDNPYEA